MVGCSKNAEQPESRTLAESAVRKPAGAGESGGAEQAGQQKHPARGSATIRGMVRFTGEVPEPVPIDMSADPYCKRINGPGQTLKTIEVDEQGGLADAFVYVASGLEGMSFDPPVGQVVLDQRNCRFVPRVFGIRVGQDLVIMNDDATLHNVHSLARRSRGFNLGMPMKGMKTVRRFSRPEVLVRIKCDVHPWMSAYAGVVDHPFYAVTDEHGRFEISGLPAGEYTIAAVHPKAGRVEARVRVKDGELRTQVLELAG
ncbi:MAG: hypothetical protein D6815_02225 [Candidatus Dadabacteria bacterium]|nr:MAG: hypothetical protein D6815_02225 [Candidatus Dadabacteria bacterium]